jgi:hypothetical protein
MMLDGGRNGRGRILSRPSVELMTTDQLTPEQKDRRSTTRAMALRAATRGAEHPGIRLGAEDGDVNEW